MTRKRLIAVIVILDGQVVQSEQFKHNHVIHYDAIHAVESFSRWDVDEIVLLNVSKCASSQQKFMEIVERVSSVCFVPLTAGGHVNNEAYGAELLRRGADKIIINSAFQNNPAVPAAIAKRFGKQCVVASIDVNTEDDGSRIVYVDRATTSTGETLVNWIKHCEDLGAGELFINNVVNDGNRKGYDLTSLSQACEVTSLPIIIFGGAFLDKHFAEGLKNGASAVAAANIFHYTEMATKKIKRYLARQGFDVRRQ